MDLLSSHQGFKKRYGLVYVDRTDDDLKELKRIKKDSFYLVSEGDPVNGAEFSPELFYRKGKLERMGI